VLVLEKGPRHERADYHHDEVHAGGARGFFVPAVEDDPHVLVKSDDPQARPERTTLGWIGSCVGGGTTRMGASYFRFHPDDFAVRSRVGAYEAVADWPYGYDELEKYYAQAEWEVGVSGSEPAFGGPRSRPYPMPPLRSHPLAERFDEACRRLSLKPVCTPRAINSRPYAGRPGCSYCDFCAGYGCPTGARGGTQESLIARAEATGNCEVRAGTMVREVTVGPDGRANGCIYLDAEGVEHRVQARIVCVCCSAVESARLLLMSRSPAFPDGLANGSGQVGRNLQFHVGSAGRAWFRFDRHPGAGLRDRHPFLERSVTEHYFLPPGISPFGKGGIIKYAMGRIHPISNSYTAAWRGFDQVLWGQALKDRLRSHFLDAREVRFEVFQDFVPNDRTHVELDPEVVDRWGLPAARMHLHHPEHHRQAGEWLVDRGLEVLGEMGADELMRRDIGYTNQVMTHGTCRAGDDPETSVLNRFCQAHQDPNLFVVDGSFMPTSGGAPSTLSIVANSFRTADYIVDRARTYEVAA
jgi:choline dehydrogenase-like flavoprotein